MIFKHGLTKAGFGIDEISSFYGILGNVNTLTNLPLTLGVAIGINLVPSISRAKHVSHEAVLTKVRSALIMIISLALPSAVGIFILAKPIFSMFFPSMSTDHLLLEISSVGIIFIMLNQIFISVLQALDHVKIPVRNIYIGGVFKLLFSYILISNPHININGAAISTVIAFFVITLLNGLSCYKLARFKLDFKFMVIIPIFNVTVMGISVLMCFSGLSEVFNSNGLITISSVVLGVLVYGILLITTKIVSIKSIPLLNRLTRR